jgi:hypothetical protein
MSQSKVGTKNSMYGKFHSDKTKELMRQNKLGKIHSEETKMLMSLKKGSLVYVYELNSIQEFDLVSTFISIRKAAEFLNTSHSMISRCIKLEKFESVSRDLFKNVYNTFSIKKNINFLYTLYLLIMKRIIKLISLFNYNFIKY